MIEELPGALFTYRLVAFTPKVEALTPETGGIWSQRYGLKTISGLGSGSSGFIITRYSIQELRHEDYFWDLSPE